MKLNEKPYLGYLAGIASILFLILISSMASAAPYAYIPNSGSNTVSVIDTATNKVTTKVDVGIYPFVATVTPDGKKVYVANNGNNTGNTVSVIDTYTKSVTATVTVGYSPADVAVSPDGSKVYVANWKDNTVSVIDTATDTVTTTVNAGNDPEAIAFSPDGIKVYVANYINNTISIFDTISNSVTATVTVGQGPVVVAVSPDGTKVYVANSGSNTISVIDAGSNSVTATVPVGVNPQGIAVRPDGTKIYVANSDSNNVSVIDIGSNSVTATVPVGKDPFGVAVTPDGKEVYVANKGSNTISIIDTAANKIEDTLIVGKAPFAYGKFIGPLPVFPLADFSANPTSGGVPISVQFTDMSKNETFRVWSFGDENISTEPNPTHTYSAKGNYNVTLIVSNVNGINSKSTIINVSERPLLPLADFITSTTSGSAPLSVQFTDASQNAASWSWDFGDGATSVEPSPMHIYSSEGIYTVNLTISDAIGAINSKTATITVQSPTPTPSPTESHSSSGGGGGGGSPEPPANVEKKELSQASVMSGKSVKFDFPNKATPVVNLSFDSEKTTGKTTTIVEMLKGKSALVSELPPDEVYKNFNVWVGKSGELSSKNIKNVVICFNVEYSWLQNDSLDMLSVTLNRYSDGKWNRLPTKRSGLDANYMYFTAETPGFSAEGRELSPFAITVNTKEKNPSPMVANDTAGLAIGDNKAVENKSNNTSTNLQKTPGFEIVSVIISLVTIFVAFRHKRK